MHPTLSGHEPISWEKGYWRGDGCGHKRKSLTTPLLRINTRKPGVHDTTSLRKWRIHIIHGHANINTPVPSASNPFSSSDHFREKTEIDGAIEAVRRLSLQTQLLRINIQQPEVKNGTILHDTTILQQRRRINLIHGYAIVNTPVPSASNPIRPSAHFRQKTDIGGAMVAVKRLSL